MHFAVRMPMRSFARTHRYNDILNIFFETAGKQECFKTFKYLDS